MRTVADIAADIVRKTPFLEEGLAKGLMNLSALARHIKPEITKRLYNEPSDASIIMALSRLRPHLTKLSKAADLKTLRNLTVRTGLIEYTFHPRTSLLVLQQKLFTEVESDKELFTSLTQGATEVTLIVSATRASLVKALIPPEGIVDTITDLAAISLKLRPEHIYTPGIDYLLLKALAWENINIIETISTYSEATFIFKETDLSRAFACLQEATSGSAV